MKCCNEDMKDFSFYQTYDIRTPHFYCNKCGRHYYKKKYYSVDEWFFYINSAVYDKQINKL